MRYFMSFKSINGGDVLLRNPSGLHKLVCNYIRLSIAC